MQEPTSQAHTAAPRPPPAQPPRPAVERGSVWVIALMVWLAVRVPRQPLIWMLHPIVCYYFCTAPQMRRHSRAFMTRVFQSCGIPRRADWRDTYKQLFTFATTLIDRARLLGGQREGLDVVLSGVDEVHATLANGGCVLLTAHIGAFDVMRASARTDRVDVRVVMDREQGARVGALLERLDPALAGRIIHAGQSGPAVMLAVKQAVAAGALVGIMADRHIEGARHTLCDVLGVQVLLPLVPYLLADVLRVPLLLGFSVLEGDNRYKVLLETLDTSDLPPKRDDRVAELAARYAVRLTAIARQYPYNWFNFHDYFGDAATGDQQLDADDGTGSRAGRAAGRAADGT